MDDVILYVRFKFLITYLIFVEHKPHASRLSIIPFNTIHATSSRDGCEGQLATARGAANMYVVLTPSTSLEILDCR